MKQISVPVCESRQQLEAWKQIAERSKIDGNFNCSGTSCGQCSNGRIVEGCCPFMNSSMQILKAAIASAEEAQEEIK